MKKYAIIFLSIIGALFIAQCSKRSNPVDTTSSQHGRYWTLYFRSDAIDNNVMDDPPYRNILVYTPPGYDPADTLRLIATGIDRIIPADSIVYGDSTNPDSTVYTPPDTIFIYGDTLPGAYYPVLYLLHGYGGDENYFRGLYDVGEIMDEMVTSGQIRPMIVATPNATNSLGGSFYTNSPDFGTGQSYAGRMQDFVTEEVTHVIDSVFNTVKDRRHRGIAGHSMGGYGAVKLAMMRNDLYGSASSMSGPVNFWGQHPADTTFLGFVSLFPAVFQESEFHPGNRAEFYAIEPGPGKRLTNMMFAMASAFSPHDPSNADTSFAHRFTTTQFEGKVDLPFDYEGNVALSVWDLWLANDVTSLFASGYGGVFDSTALYLDAGSEDDLYLNLQTQIFNSVAHADQFEIYNGDPGHFAADHMSMIATRLRKVFKFHDEAFNR